ncbi:hypothetical protein F5B19DRAFT_502070 [Rostrohypoxylon terebratum]|nr:hypothetical protein F5B19DRAFT_502070 [Rostrohypoxylon terebratum]
MFQVPVSGPSLPLRDLRDEEITAVGPKHASIFPYNFDGTGTTMGSTKNAKPAEKSSRRGDGSEHQLDDITHHERVKHHKPGEICSWNGDPAEPEYDNLAHHSDDERYRTLSPKTVAKPETPGTPPKTPLEEAVVDDAPANEDPPEKGKEKKPAFNFFRGIIGSAEKPEEKGLNEGEKLPAKESIAPEQPPTPEEPQAPLTTLEPVEPHPVPSVPTVDTPYPGKGKKSKEDKERLKQEKVEAKKAEKEKKVQIREEKRRVKKEKDDAKKELRRQRKDEKKNKGKDIADPPPGFPAVAEGTAAADADLESGCQLCHCTEGEGLAEPKKQPENEGSVSHGLDGNSDWPLTAMQNHFLRSLEPMSTPDAVTTQSPQAYSPFTFLLCGVHS